MILDRLVPQRRQEERAISFQSLFALGDGYTFTTNSGVYVTQEDSLKIGTVYACVRLIADTIASLPVDSYIRQEGVRLQYRPRPVLKTHTLLADVRIDRQRGNRVGDETHAGVHRADLQRVLLSDVDARVGGEGVAVAEREQRLERDGSFLLSSLRYETVKNHLSSPTFSERANANAAARQATPNTIAPNAGATNNPAATRAKIPTSSSTSTTILTS